MATTHGTFIPTFYKEQFYVPERDGSCPPSFSVTGSPGVCVRLGNHFVTGAELTRVIFNHEFSVTPHENSLNLLYKLSDLKSHSGSFNSDGWDKGMVTVLFDADGEETARFEQSEAVNLTIEHLMGAAAFDGRETGQRLTFDQRYGRPSVGIDEGATVRLTGAALVVDLYTTDRGKCPVYDVFRKVVRTNNVYVGRPVTCMTVFAERRWVSEESSEPLGLHGGMRIRHMSGVQVRFRKMGVFRYLDEQQVIQNLTVFFVWIQLPLVMTYWFCVMCLGTLSHIYSRVIHQELNLQEACRGLVARLLCHSAAYMDLADHSDGISKHLIGDRMRDYLRDKEEIDDDELGRFVEFAWTGLKSQGGHPGVMPDYVSVQEFVEVCAQNEPLKFQALVRLFDQDRLRGVLENLFLDKSMREMNTAAEQDPFDITKFGELGGSHSRVQTAEMEVQEIMTDLEDAELRILASAKDLVIGDEVQAVISAPGQTPPAAELPAKLDQRESFISIADEDEDDPAGAGDVS